MTRSTSIRRAALGLCLVVATASSALAYSAGYIQTIKVTSRHGVSNMSQYYSPNRVAPSHTRVCLKNNGPRKRALTHSMRTRPLRARPYGGVACADFPSDARVPFGVQDGNEPARTSVAMVMSLSAFRGGVVTFVWN